MKWTAEIGQCRWRLSTVTVCYISQSRNGRVSQNVFDICINVVAETCSVHFYCIAESHTSTVWGVDFDSTGDRLVSCSDDRTLKVWKAYRPDNPQGNQLLVYFVMFIFCVRSRPARKLFFKLIVVSCRTQRITNIPCFVWALRCAHTARGAARHVTHKSKRFWLEWHLVFYLPDYAADVRTAPRGTA